MHRDGAYILERVLSNCRQMLLDRGARGVVQVENPLKVIETGNVLPILQTMGDGSPSTRIYISKEDKVSIKFARAAIEDAGAECCERIVIVSIEGPTPFSKRECDGKPVQFFLAKDVFVNKARHSLVPRHEVVESPPGNVTVQQLPRILDSDPVVQYFHFPVGAVLKITRVFGGCEEVPYFRVVVSSGVREAPL